MSENIVITLENTILQRINTPTLNGRIYSERVLKDALETNAGRDIMGTLGLNKEMIGSNEIDISKIAFMVQNMRIEDGALRGDIRTLATPQGNVFKSMLQEGKHFDFRIAGYGTVGPNQEVSKFILSTVGAVEITKDEHEQLYSM